MPARRERMLLGKVGTKVTLQLWGCLVATIPVHADTITALDHSSMLIRDNLAFDLTRVYISTDWVAANKQ